MSIEADVYKKLTYLSVPVYPVKIKQESDFPCIVYTVVSEVDKVAENAGEVAYKNYRFQVDVFSKSYKEAKELKDKVIEAVTELGATDISVVDMWEEEVFLYRELIDFTIKGV